MLVALQAVDFHILLLNEYLFTFQDLREAAAAQPGTRESPASRRLTKSLSRLLERADVLAAQLEASKSVAPKLVCLRFNYTILVL